MAGSSSGRSVEKNSNHDEQMDESLVGRSKGHKRKEREEERRVREKAK